MKCNPFADSGASYLHLIGFINENSPPGELQPDVIIGWKDTSDSKTLKRTYPAILKLLIPHFDLFRLLMMIFIFEGSASENSYVAQHPLAE